MFQPLTAAIGLRYLRAKRRNGFISFISMASVLGIFIGVVALITTISVMNGFQQELRTRILGTVAHATIEDNTGALADWRGAMRLAQADARVAGAAPYVQTEALLQGRQRQGALLRGIDPSQEGAVSDLPDKMVEGRLDSLQAGAFNIVLGSELATALNVRPGDSVNVLVTETTATPFGSMPRAKRFTVTGIFSVGAQEYDYGLALVNLEDGQKLLRLGEQVTGVRLKLHDIWQAWSVARDLANRMEGIYSVRDWSSDHANFFRALKMEKTVMFILLSLVVAIAAFNLVSSQVMLVQDKQADIAILRTLGMSPRQVMQVFMLQGLAIGLVGVALGAVAGVLLSKNLGLLVRFIESLTGNELMPSDVYYISGVPTVVDPGDVLLVIGIAILMCLFATLYPAWRAARTNPVEALRYE